MNSCEVSFLNAVNVLQMDQEGTETLRKAKSPITSTVFHQLSGLNFQQPGWQLEQDTALANMNPSPTTSNMDWNLLKNYTKHSAFPSGHAVFYPTQSTSSSLDWTSPLVDHMEDLPVSRKAPELQVQGIDAFHLTKLWHPPRGNWGNHVGHWGTHHGGEKPAILYCWKMPGRLVGESFFPRRLHVSNIESYHFSNTETITVTVQEMPVLSHCIMAGLYITYIFIKEIPRKESCRRYSSGANPHSISFKAA